MRGGINWEHKRRGKENRGEVEREGEERAEERGWREMTERERREERREQIEGGGKRRDSEGEMEQRD